MQYWDFLLGGVALGLVAVGFVAAVRRPLGVSGAVGGLVGAPGGDAGPGLGAPLSRVEQAAFLAAIAVGAGLSALLAGTWGQLDGTAIASRGFGPASLGLGPVFAARFGDGALGWAVVGGGAVLVGVGTQWARGCTSGHGLMGVARLQKGSLVATAVFFGTAIIASVLVDVGLGGR
jgi:uncharacterized membrane protein YedE/YeeE